MEVAMKRSKRIWALLVMCCLASAAVGAHAAGAYTLTCEPERGATLTLTLTGFNFKVAGGAESPTGMAAGKRSNFELSIRFALNKDYEALVSMAEDNELLRSCKLTDGEVSGGVAASDNWTQMSAKGKNNNKAKNNAAPASSGAFEWILTNATITSVSAIGSENTSGASESSVQATIEAQKFSFTM
jgi:hypothetical protein